MHRFLHYVGILLKWRRLLLANVMGLTVLMAVVSFLLPSRYSAEAKILPPPEEDLFGISSALGGGLGGGSLNRLVAGAFLGGATQSDLMVAVLDSRSVMQSVAERCSIVDYYRVRNRSPEGAVRKLRDMVDLAVTDEGLVSISAEAKTPELAARIANTFLDQLDHFMRNSNMSRGRNLRIFVGGRLAATEARLSQAEESLQVFQERHSITSVDDEMKVAIDAYASLKSQLQLKEAELEMMRSVSQEGNPYTANLKTEIAAFRSQLGHLERGKPGSGHGVGFAVTFESLPAIAAEYFRRYRDYRVQAEAYGVLFQQYEYARILEARDTPTLTVLDRALPPERRSFPRRSLLVFAALVFSLAVGACLAFSAEYFDRIRTLRPAEYEGWLDVRSQMVALLRSPLCVLRRKSK